MPAGWAFSGLRNHAMTKRVRLAILGLAVILAAGGGLAAMRLLAARQTSKPPTQIPAPTVALEAVHMADASAATDPWSLTWDQAPRATVPLTFQVMYVPWSTTAKPPVSAAAIYDDQRIYFLIEWEDSTCDAEVHRTDQFPDACAVMFPLNQAQPPSLMMGFFGPANIWHWKADWQTRIRGQAAQSSASSANVGAPSQPTPEWPLAEFAARAAGAPQAQDALTSPVEDLVAEGPGTITTKPSQHVQGHGEYRDGKWRVVFWRELQPADQTDAAFSPGQNRLMAFAVWDGAHQEKGSRKSISDWVELRIQQHGGQK